MGENLNINAVNQVEQNTVIYEKREPLTSVSLIIKGRVLVETDGIRTIFSSGNFLGACDVGNETHSFTYTAYDNVVLCTFSVRTEEEFMKVLDQKKEYYGLLNTSLNFFIVELNQTYEELIRRSKLLKEFVCEKYEFYQEFGKENGLNPIRISAIELLMEEKQQEQELEKKLPYYLACAKIPVESQKNYYMGSRIVSQLHFSEQCDCVASLLFALSRKSKEMMHFFRVLILDEMSLFRVVARMALDTGHVGNDNTKALSIVDEIIQQINDAEVFLVKKVGLKIDLNRKQMEGIYYAILTGEDDLSLENVQESIDTSVLAGSLEQILSFASIDAEIKEEFTRQVEDFIQLSDKFSKNEEAVRVRKSLAKYYYEIYESVLLKSFCVENIPTPVSLFLNYGFVSEVLLDGEAQEKLLKLRSQDKYKDGSRVYLLPEWLRAVYNGERVPSRNEFDQDYEEYLRHEKATGNIDEEQMKLRLNDPKARVHFEIQNMFRYANRILHGRISLFVPILFSGQFFTSIENAYLTPDRINGALNMVQTVDFSVFYREQVVFYNEVDISKEIIMQKFLPDIILFPIYGQNGVMWQETTGKRKGTKGRFFFPVLLENKLEQEMLKVMGEFRWEICRAEQGMHWNNLHYPSLTSEYTDYLQFYRKNQNLSSDAKTKIKSQLTQCNNKHRSVFCRDYADWISRESAGAMRINKVARGILATYCPFRKEIREKINEQPIYAEAGKRFVLARSKALKQLENSCKRFEKEGLEIPEELKETRDYLENT